MDSHREQTHRAVHGTLSPAFQWFAKSEDASSFWALLNTIGMAGVDVELETDDDIPSAAELLDCSKCYDTRKDPRFNLFLIPADDELARYTIES